MKNVQKIVKGNAGVPARKKRVLQKRTRAYKVFLFKKNEKENRSLFTGKIAA